MATLVEDEATVMKAVVAVSICKQDQAVEPKVDRYIVVAEYMVATMKGIWQWYK